MDIFKWEMIINSSYSLEHGIINSSYSLEHGKMSVIYDVEYAEIDTNERLHGRRFFFGNNVN